MRTALRYLRNVLIAIDQLVNAILGGDPDETISSRVAKHRGHGDFGDYASQALDAIDPGQPPVKDNDVIATLATLGRGRWTVSRPSHLVAFSLEKVNQPFSRRLVVLNNENSHESLSAWPDRSG